MIVSEDFQDTEDLDGLFSGYDPEMNTYDQSSWAYEGQQHDDGMNDERVHRPGDGNGGRDRSRGRDAGRR